MTMTVDIPAAVAARPRGFRQGEAVSLSGATYRQLDWWARTGVLWPSIANPSGSGHQRRWSFEDLVAASVLLAVSGQRERTAVFAEFRNKALSMALHLHVDTFGDWDAYLLLVDHEPMLMPSAEAAVERMLEVQQIHPTSLIAFVDMGAHARRIAKEILDEATL